MNPPKGYYRELLKDTHPHIRIAFTHSPIIGCTIVNPKSVLEVLDRSTDEHSKFYTEGLRNGTLATIVENYINEEYWAPGELFFKS
jgi:hypothetical protein